MSVVTDEEGEEEDTWRVVATLPSHPIEPVTPPPTFKNLTPVIQSQSQVQPLISSQNTNLSAPPCFDDWDKEMKKDASEYDLDSDAWNGIHSKIMSYRFEKALLLEVLKDNAGTYVYI